MLHRPGVIVAGKYRLEKPLARGGVGTVWVAHHVQLGHAVAVKFLDPRVAQVPQVRTRFEREARAAAHLRTPHIVQVFDYGIDGDTPYLAMELLHGETLHARLRKVKRLSLTDAYRILVQMGKGLKRAHDVGFVHRDLKPANIYLSRNDDEEEDTVKILDFGIAKEAGAEVGESTKTGELVGSPHYMSPEQIRGEREVDARSDLWALGVILFKAITGELPFPGEVLTAVITKIVVDPIPSAREYLPEAPAALDAFFAKALSRDRSQRFQSVRELVQAFGEVAALDAGVQNAHALSPIVMSGTYRASSPSLPDSQVPSIFPSSFPGAPLSGSLPGTPQSGSFPGSFAAPPPPSVPSWLGAPSVPPASSSPSMMTTPGTAMPQTGAPPARRSRWAFVAAMGAAALIGIGLTIGAMGLRGGDDETRSTGSRSAATSAPQATEAPRDPATATATATAEPAATVEPAVSASASGSAAAGTAAPGAGPARPGGGGGKVRPPAGKKPVDTID